MTGELMIAPSDDRIWPHSISEAIESVFCMVESVFAISVIVGTVVKGSQWSMFWNATTVVDSAVIETC